MSVHKSAIYLCEIFQFEFKVSFLSPFKGLITQQMGLVFATSIMAQLYIRSLFCPLLVILNTIRRAEVRPLPKVRIQSKCMMRIMKIILLGNRIQGIGKEYFIAIEFFLQQSVVLHYNCFNCWNLDNTSSSLSCDVL